MKADNAADSYPNQPAIALRQDLKRLRTLFLPNIPDVIYPGKKLDVLLSDAVQSPIFSTDSGSTIFLWF